MLKLATEMIYRLADYAEAKNLTYPIDRPYVVNRLLEIMRMNAPEEIDYVSEAIPETATAYLEKLADEYGLIKTGGSDFHGFSKPDIQLGTGKGDLDVPREWLEKLREAAKRKGE